MPTARYWRARFDSISGTYLVCSEMEMRATSGGADVTSTSYASSSFGTAANAFDDNTSTITADVPSGFEWIKQDFGSDQEVQELTYRNGGTAIHSPDTLYVEYSSNGTDWTEAHNETGLSWSTNETKTFTFTDGDVNVNATTEALTLATYQATVDDGLNKIEWVGGDSGRAGANTDNIALTLPTHQADDIAIVFGKSDEAGTVPTLGIGVATGYTELFQDNHTGGRDRVSAGFWKRLTSDSETNPELTIDVAEEHTAALMVFRVVDTTTAFDVTYTSSDGTNNANPTNPAITTATANSAVVLLHNFTHNDHSALGAPSGYTLGPGETSSAANHRGIATAYLLDAGAAGTKTPGAWRHTASPTNIAEYSLYTLALRVLQSTGEDVDLDAGSFTLSGSAATISTDTSVAAAAGSFSLTGYSAIVSTSTQVDLDAGSFAWTGFDAGLTFDTAVSADAGLFSLTGHDADIAQALNIGAAGGAYALTGYDTGISLNTAVAPGIGAYTLSGFDAAVSLDLGVTPDAGSFTWTGFGADLALGRAIAPDAGSFSLTGLDVGIATNLAVQLDAGSYTLTGLDVSIAGMVAVAADAGSFTLTGYDATLTEGAIITADAGSFALSGYDAAITTAFTTEFAAGSFALTGYDASLSTASGADIEAEAGSFNLTGFDGWVNVVVAAGAMERHVSGSWPAHSATGAWTSQLTRGAWQTGTSSGVWARHKGTGAWKK